MAIIRLVENSCSLGSYSWPRLRHSERCSGVAPIEVLGGLGILALRVEDLGQAEVKQQSFRVRQIRFFQQVALRGPIRLGKSAAHERRQIVMRDGEAGIVLQRRAERRFRGLEVADLLQSAAQVVVRVGKIGLQLECPVEAGDGFLQLALVLQRNTKIVIGLGKAGLEF